MHKTVIWRARNLDSFKAGLCSYEDSAWIEKHATLPQEQAIVDLEAQVVPHSWLGEREGHALVSLRGYPQSTAAWIAPDGTVTKTDMSPGYWCHGNPTVAHCIAAGYCRRSRACND